MDWRDFVESMSIVEQTLRADSARVYADMDFATRDQYRHMVERISKLADVSEADVAGRTVELARQGCDEYGLDHPRAHVGYYLIDVGIAELERDTGRSEEHTSELQSLRRISSAVFCLKKNTILE